MEPEIDAFQTTLANAAQKDGSPMEIDDSADNNLSLSVMRRETQTSSAFWKLVHVLCIKMCILSIRAAPSSNF